MGSRSLALLLLVALWSSRLDGPAWCDEVPSLDGYRVAWQRLLDTYGNAIWTVSVEGASEEQRTIRLLARWPAVRVEWMQPGGTFRTAAVFSPQASFRVRRIGKDDKFALESWSQSEQKLAEFWTYPSNDGWLPFAALSWLGEPLVDTFVRPDKEIVRTEWVDDAGGRQLFVEMRFPQWADSTAARARFWFAPEKAWILRRWELFAESDPESGRVCEFRYRDDPRGVPLVTWGRYGVRGGRTLWEAKVLEAELSPPPETVFSPEAFGIPSPIPEKLSRLWLWVLLALLLLLSALILARLARWRATMTDVAD